jgi:D-serine deaminase-like pyridoxal phosphate-dependent protein
MDLAERLRGRSTEELRTPVALLDLDGLEHNIATMAAHTAARPSLRPHAKTHKSVEIAQRQLAAGAIGVTVATTGECLAMARAGIGELLLANELVAPARLADAVEAATHVPVIVEVDDAEPAAALALAARARGVSVGVLIEVDVGMHRGGTRSVAETVALARALEPAAALHLRGLAGYEGHAVTERDLERRTQMCATAMDLLAEHVAAVQDLGIAVEVVSAGGTNTSMITNRHPIVTELQAGTYALMDTAYEPFAPEFSPALTVLGTVVSVHEPRAIVDCGTKVMGVTDLAPPRLIGSDATIVELHEEHTLLDLGEQPLRRGDRVQFVVGFAGGTVNLHDYYVVIKDGIVHDVWPIVARGPGWQ